MHAFALAVFIVHTLFELAFGLRACITGGSSSQSREQIAAQPLQSTIAARFLGSALTALGVLRAAAADRSVLAPVFTRGALVTHGVLAVAFALLALLLAPGV